MCKSLKRKYEYGNLKSIDDKIGYRTAFIDLNKINDDVQLNAINDVNNEFIVRLLRGNLQTLSFPCILSLIHWPCLFIVKLSLHLYLSS